MTFRGGSARATHRTTHQAPPAGFVLQIEFHSEDGTDRILCFDPQGLFASPALCALTARRLAPPAISLRRRECLAQHEPRHAHRLLARRVAAAPHAQLDGLAGRALLDGAQQVLHLPDGHVAYGRDQVAQRELAARVAARRPQPRLRRGAARHDIHHEHAVERPPERRREGAHLLVVGDVDAERGARDAAVEDQLVDDAPHRVDRDREADADVACEASAARGLRREDGGVHADQPAARVKQRPARVARVDRRVGLDAAFDRPAAHAVDLAPERRDDARRESVVEPKPARESEPSHHPRSATCAPDLTIGCKCATGHGLESAADATGHGLSRAAGATGHGFESRHRCHGPRF
mmetsp:Transcript_19959/g.53827  ORF Transcript_19959/g.53827 Transcript_19959/m.53827 type:complete len:351 (-) Transcript_19959:955-2007(-)